jgi:hypothetical protein
MANSIVAMRALEFSNHRAQALGGIYMPSFDSRLTERRASNGTSRT